MKILFLDIDGYVVNADIQEYVSKIELFSDELIKDFEYIKNCIQFMLEEAKKKEENKEEIIFIQKVYQFVNLNMFEMLKEYRDCFLEFDNLESFEDKKQYLKNYQMTSIKESNSEEIPKYMQYIIEALRYAKLLIEREYARVSDRKELRLPFKTQNVDNDIINYRENEDARDRATSALRKMEIYANNRETGSDDFLIASRMAGDAQVVDYNTIYTKQNLKPGVVEGLKYLIQTGKVAMIVACSHYTGPREAIAKKRLFEEELPFVYMLPKSLLKFHTEPAQMGKRRVRSSKNDRINEMKKTLADSFGMNPNKITAILGDDSSPNLAGLEDSKIGILYRERTTQEISTGMNNPTDQRFVRQTSWNIEELERIFEAIGQNRKSEEAYKIKKIGEIK